MSYPCLSRSVDSSNNQSQLAFGLIVPDLPTQVYVSSGLEEKVDRGYAVGPPPLGYMSEILSGRKGERKVPDPQTMPILLSALEAYSTGPLSFRDVADHLNADGFRTRNGRLFAGSSIRDVLGNRFYEGKVDYHEGQPDEVVVDGLIFDLLGYKHRCLQIVNTRLSSSARPDWQHRFEITQARSLSVRSCVSLQQG